MDDYMIPTRLAVRLRIADLLDDRGETQHDLARSMRMNQSMVSRKLAGKTMWTLDDLDLVARHFKTTVAQLVCDDRERRMYASWCED